MTERSLFIAALEHDPAARADFLEQACAGDAALHDRVERLLAAHVEAGSFLEGTVDAVPIAERPGVVIGPYKLLEQIGEGGFGLVFVAEQQQPVRRRVALKVIKPGMDSKQVIARFEAERQALALMDHQNIARVFDAGTTDSGRPYFVMELVHGVPITEYCDANRLTPRQRLELFLPVCHAIQHAHQKGIIHRDIKPSNILVTMYDDKPVPKVIDFGIAKATEQRLTERTVYTQFGTMVGTFEYMSPEQAEMNAFGVDTRSDVYALGVLLYELLTGSTPLERGRLRAAAFDEIRRIIKEEEPPRPSVRLTTSETLAKVAAARQMDPAKLSRLVRGELDWVVMKCLEKDRTRRYATANDLARDVERYLADEAVEACPPTTSYRLWKFAGRYRKALTVVGAFVALLLVGFVLVAWMWHAERAARAEADTARQDAEANARQVQDGAERMNAASAALDLGYQHTRHRLWAEAEAAHTRAIHLRDDSAQVWLGRGEMYANLGLWELAAQDYERAFACREPDAVQSWYCRALLRALVGDQAGYRQVCARMFARFGDSTSLPTQVAIARACSLCPDALADNAALRRLVDATPEAGGLAWVRRYLRGVGLYRTGRAAEAVRELRGSLDQTTYRARAMNYPFLALTLHNLGQEDAARQELDRTRQILDRGLASLAGAAGTFCPWDYWYDWAEFQLVYQEAHRALEQVPAPDDPRRCALRGLALAALRSDGPATAEFARALQLAPNDHTLRVLAFRFQVGAQRWAEAATERAAMKRLQPNDPSVHVEAFRAYAASGNWERATAEYQAALRLRPDDLPLLLERFRFHTERGEAAAAAAAYTAATQGRDQDIPFRVKLGDACASLRLWSRACDEYARILDAGLLGDGEVNRTTWLRLAALQLYFGAVEDYRRTCTRLVERHGADPDWRVCEHLVRICLLHPEPGVPPARVLELAERAGRGRGQPDMSVHIDALAALRAGKRDLDDTALKAARIKHQWDTQRIALARLYHEAGTYNQARNLMNLVTANARILDPNAGPLASWDLGLEVQLWYRQAEAIIHSERWKAVDELVKQRRWATAIEALGPLLTPADRFGGDWGLRSRCYAELGLWKEAAADGARANALAPTYLPGVTPYAIICLRGGAREKYQQLCRAAVERHAAATDRLVLNNAAWLCALDPAAAASVPRALTLIDRALNQETTNTYVHTRACLLYRAGRYEEALKQFTDLIAQPSYPVNAYDWLFLAMTEARLGQHATARKHLEQSSAWLDTRPHLDWQRKAELHLFRTEAAALIQAQR